MCDACDADVAAAGVFLDDMVALHRHTNEEHAQTHSSAQQCIRLAQDTYDSYLENQGHSQLRQLCLGFAVAVHRLSVLQQINGGAL
jgi:hypothetical protein